MVAAKAKPKNFLSIFCGSPLHPAVFLEGKEIFGFACTTGGSAPEAQWKRFVRSVRTHEINSTRSVPLPVPDFLQSKFGFRPKGTAILQFLRKARLLRSKAPLQIQPKTQKMQIGGETGIRTQETLAGLTVFKTAAFDHSAISPH